MLPEVEPEVVLPEVVPVVLLLEVVPEVVPDVVPSVELPDVLPAVVEPEVLPEVEPLVEPAFSEVEQALNNVSDEQSNAPVTMDNHLGFVFISVRKSEKRMRSH